MNNILRFKYSFTALVALMSAIVLNLLLVVNLKLISMVSIVFIVLVLILRIFDKNNNILLSFISFFIIGLFSSGVYNANYRVFELPNYINEEKAWVKGEISAIKVKGKYARAFISNPEIYSDTADNLYIPNMIISTFSSRLIDAKVGDELVAKVLLKKPSKKSFIDDFDYSNYLLQQNINLTAQVRGALYITTPKNGYSILQQVQNYRASVANKIISSFNDARPAGVAAALITGSRGFLDYDTKEDFKKSGLAHLMAISGMHMAFLAAIIFVLVRYAVCCIPVIALNYDSKKIAGFITVLCCLFYLLLAGGSLPTIRAFIMITLFVFTMLINRSKVALHTLCVVAMLILLFDPMAIFSASFQLSFSAVFAMLVYNELKEQEIILSHTTFSKLLRAFSNTVNISIIAFTATMFFVSAHFGYLSVFSIFANVIASLLMALLIMPTLFAYFVGFVLFDIKAFALISEWSLTLLTDLAKYFANFENSSVFISNNYSVVLFFVALIILTVIILNFNRKYLIALFVFTIAFFIPIKFDMRPKIIELNNAVVLRQDDNLILIGNADKSTMKKLLSFYRLKQIENNLDKVCDISGCIYTFNNKKILQMNEGFNISNEDLTLVDYVVKNL